MPRFQALTDLTLPGGSYIQAGTVFDAPPGWPPPTNAVTPLDPDATQLLWNQGPRGMSDAECWRALFTNSGRWTGLPVPGPSVYWVNVGRESFILTGGGGNLGPHDRV
jgi:hypothetical protein